MERGARLLAALLLALLVGYVFGDSTSYGAVAICLLIALVTGLPSLTGGWTLLAGLTAAPLFAWSYLAGDDHPPFRHEENDALLGFFLWLTNSAFVVACAIVIAIVRTIRGAGSAT